MEHKRCCVQYMCLILVIGSFRYVERILIVSVQHSIQYQTFLSNKYLKGLDLFLFFFCQHILTTHSGLRKMGKALLTQVNQSPDLMGKYIPILFVIAAIIWAIMHTSVVFVFSKQRKHHILMKIPIKALNMRIVQVTIAVIHQVWEHTSFHSFRVL